MADIYTPVLPDTAMSLLGEGIHTGLRKAGTGPKSAEIWNLIHDDLESWSNAVAFAVYGLESMGYAVCKKEETSG